MAISMVDDNKGMFFDQSTTKEEDDESWCLYGGCVRKPKPQRDSTNTSKDLQLPRRGSMMLKGRNIKLGWGRGEKERLEQICDSPCILSRDRWYVCIGLGL